VQCDGVSRQNLGSGMHEKAVSRSIYYKLLDVNAHIQYRHYIHSSDLLRLCERSYGLFPRSSLFDPHTNTLNSTHP
jgi:hypothetical protein